MDNTSLIIKVPGKLMIAGEYAVLSTGYPAVVTAVNRYITIKIYQCDQFKISYYYTKLPEVVWSFDDKGSVIGLEKEKYAFIREAISTACRYLKEKSVMIAPFHLKIQNELNDSLTGKKYGLGSSSAIVVGVISAILAFHEQGLEEDRLTLYKLSCISHLKSQGNGSGADIAAAVFGGWLCYYRYDLSWLTKRLADQKEGITKLVNIPWPYLGVERIKLPSNIKIVAGWTKHTAKTSPLVDKIEAFQRDNTKQYDVFLEESKIAVKELISSCKRRYEAGILTAIHRNRTALQYLSDITGMQLETKEIKTLCQIADQYGAGKFSGAGGGDCGFAILTSAERIGALRQEWKQAGIIPLDIRITKQGVICYRKKMPNNNH